MNRKLKHIPVIDRPREKLKQKGSACLSDLELFAVLLGSGTKKMDVLGIAREIAARFQHDSDIVKKFKALQDIQGIGPAKAAQIMAAFELTRRHLKQEKHAISSPQDLMPFIEKIRHKKQEHFVIVTLDGGSCIIKQHVIFIGTLNQSLVHPREIFGAAINDRARSIFLIHNHPSGRCKPSGEDILITERLVQVGNIMGIEVIDHIILGSDDYFSFKANAYL